MSAEIKTLSSKVVYENKWMRVREDAIERQSGQQGIYSVMEKPDFTVVIPVQDGYVYMVEQYRYPVEKRQLEFPQGTWEENDQADPAELAAGELQEETGLLAKNWTHVGYQYLAYGFCNQGYHIWIATDFTMTEQNLDPEEEGLTCHRIALSDLDEMVKKGEILDATTCNALGLARLKGLI